MKSIIRRIPILGPWAHRVFGRTRHQGQFSTSAQYWESRYASGKNSGLGSYDELADFKARVLNEFVSVHDIQSVVEFGCGDGNQLRLAKYPEYVGYDVSPTAVESCRRQFANDPTKRFELVDDYRGEISEMSLSLDVIYHLVEDPVYHSYMSRLFDASRRYVSIYSSNNNSPPGSTAPHVRHRKFIDWLTHNRPQWQMIQQITNPFPFKPDTGEGSPADFYFFEATS